MLKPAVTIHCRCGKSNTANFAYFVPTILFFFTLLYQVEPTKASVPFHSRSSSSERYTASASVWEKRLRTQLVGSLENSPQYEWLFLADEDLRQDALSPTDRLVQDPTFENVTAAVGIVKPGLSRKFGGPCVADLNADGIYDLVLSDHNTPKVNTTIYFGNGDGTFTMSNFTTGMHDVHGITVAQRTAYSRNRMLSISIGGGRGKNPRIPEHYLVGPDKSITNISLEFGLGQIRTSGRVSLFMELGRRSTMERRQNLGGPDIVVTVYAGYRNSTLKQFAYRNIQGNFSDEVLEGFEDQERGRVEVTDVDDDQVLELIAVHDLLFFKLEAPFKLTDVTRKLMPNNTKIERHSATAVVEIDYDNDGLMDLYIARINRSLISNIKPAAREDSSDLLLRNVGGKYENVTAEAGIPPFSESMGVTAGDFNNDGYMDLFVVQFEEPDFILMNQGDGTFRRLDGLVPKDPATLGNHAAAVDYDLDGRVDIIVGHGGVDGMIGPYSVMRNTMPLSENNHYLLVKVANEPTRAATPIQAVVTVYVAGRVLKRRVGSVGAQDSFSYLDTLHFGLGSATRADCVQVQWSNRGIRKFRDVAADQKIMIGVI